MINDTTDQPTHDTRRDAENDMALCQSVNDSFVAEFELVPGKFEDTGFKYQRSLIIKDRQGEHRLGVIYGGEKATLDISALFCQSRTALPHWINRAVLAEAEVARLNARLADVTEALGKMSTATDDHHGALSIYFAEAGTEHYDDCPQDDTCDCEHVAPMYEATSKLNRIRTEVHDLLRLHKERQELIR